MFALPPFWKLTLANLTARRSRWFLGVALVVGGAAFGLHAWLRHLESVPELRFESATQEFVRRAWWGGTLWRTRVDEGSIVFSLLRPDWVRDSERVYVALDDCVTAIDWSNGRRVWGTTNPRNLGIASELAVTDGLLVAVWHDLRDSHEDEELEWDSRVLAVDARTGVLCWERAYHGSYVSIASGSDLVIASGVRSEDVPGEITVIHDSAGTITCTLDEEVIGASQSPDGHILLTRHGARGMDKCGRLTWRRLYWPHNPQFDVGGGSDVAIRPLPNGDYLAVWYCSIWDSGVNVARFSGTDGNCRWTNSCAPLGAWIGCFSLYRQRAELSVSGASVVVRCNDDDAYFCESLRLDNGQSVSRVDSETVERWRSKLRFW